MPPTDQASHARFPCPRKILSSTEMLCETLRSHHRLLRNSSGRWRARSQQEYLPVWNQILGASVLPSSAPSRQQFPAIRNEHFPPLSLPDHKNKRHTVCKKCHQHYPRLIGYQSVNLTNSTIWIAVNITGIFFPDTQNIGFVHLLG